MEQDGGYSGIYNASIPEKYLWLLELSVDWIDCATEGNEN